MLMLPPSVKVYLATGPVDMRKSIDGLMGVVRAVWRDDPYSGHLFVFLSRDRKRAKILFFDHGGFCVFYKRLEKNRFHIPQMNGRTGRVEMDATELAMLLQGIDWSRVQRPRLWAPRPVATPQSGDSKRA